MLGVWGVLPAQRQVVRAFRSGDPSLPEAALRPTTPGIRGFMEKQRRGHALGCTANEHRSWMM
jgi:hypothetical protein